MYLHLGEEVLIKSEDIVGIFDLEKTSVSKRTKEFLVDATKKDTVITVSYEMPKSFVITNENGKDRVYITQISAATINKRQNKLNGGGKFK